MTRVFISYRRIDTKWPVGRLYDRLSEVLNRENIFLDVSDIEPGEDYVERIKQIIETCDILLAVIGPKWLTMQDTSGRRRIDNPNDWVRVEIATALNRRIRIIPILVDDAIMPEQHELPEDLVGLSRRNAKVVSFMNFHSEMDSLLRVLEKVLNTIPEEKKGTETKHVQLENEIANDFETETTELPLTICIETKGGVASPLIKRGENLPAKYTEIFSTATDNQPAITIQLLWGERQMAEDNLKLGNFELEIPPAPATVPQIEITTKVEKNLMLSVIAKDLGTGRKEILDAVDLSQIDIPKDMLFEAKAKPRKAKSSRDLKNNINFSDFSDIFKEFGFSSMQYIDIEETIYVSPESTQTENEVELKNGQGKTIKIKIPKGIKDGQKLRVRGQGKTNGMIAGNLYIIVRITDKTENNSSFTQTNFR